MSEKLPSPAPGDSGEFILYQTEDGQTRIEVRMENETVIYDDGELDREATSKRYLIVQTEGNREVSKAAIASLGR